MNRYRPRHSLQTPSRGFTLIELMIAVVVVGILAAVAIPAYDGMIRKSRRADAVASLTGMQQSQERWRANNASYTDTLTNLQFPPTNYYTLSIESATATGYVVRAVAVSGKSQAADTGCTTLSLTLQGGNVSYDPSSCWSR